jgi:hypothetical protein
MKAKNWGRIVNMALIYGMFATVNQIDYITTKTALIGLTRAVALEVAQTGITCNAFCPGTVLTPVIDWRLRQEMQRDGSSFAEAEARFLEVRQPSPRFVKDENVAGLIAFLCGPHGEDINGSARRLTARGWRGGDEPQRNRPPDASSCQQSPGLVCHQGGAQSEVLVDGSQCDWQAFRQALGLCPRAAQNVFRRNLGKIHRRHGGGLQQCLGYTFLAGFGQQERQKRRGVQDHAGELPSRCASSRRSCRKPSTVSPEPANTACASA